METANFSPSHMQKKNWCLFVVPQLKFKQNKTPSKNSMWISTNHKTDVSVLSTHYNPLSIMWLKKYLSDMKKKTKLLLSESIHLMPQILEQGLKMFPRLLCPQQHISPRMSLFCSITYVPPVSGGLVSPEPGSAPSTYSARPPGRGRSLRRIFPAVPTTCVRGLRWL